MMGHRCEPMYWLERRGSHWDSDVDDCIGEYVDRWWRKGLLRAAVVAAADRKSYVGSVVVRMENYQVGCGEADADAAGSNILPFPGFAAAVAARRAANVVAPVPVAIPETQQ